VEAPTDPGSPVTTPPVSVKVDVSEALPITGKHHVAAWVFPPPSTDRPVPLLFCLPGGSYTKAYWHLEVPGHSGYSFAEHLAAQGMLVIAVDHIGVGESSRHPRAIELMPDVVAAANAAAFDALADRARHGTLLPNLGPLDIGTTVGVGHSMGAMLAIFQQSLHGSFDAIASLGFGTAGPIVTFGTEGGVGAPNLESILASASAGLLDEPFMADRTMPAMREHFYWDDVPPEVIAADDETNAHLPGVTGPLSIVPYIATDHAGRVRCPVFIGFGERDSTPNHRDEMRAYYSSKDVTMYVLERSAHCHNTAGTRQLLWDRLAGWVRSLPHPPGSAS
jgi:pimeloyl-ACP methyl ester carboxylesterase